MTQATFDTTYDEEQKKYGTGLQEAQQQAAANLTKGSVYSGDRFKEITDYYAKPYLEAAGQRQQLISQYMRSRGLYDSGAHSDKLVQDMTQSERDVSANVYVPLMKEQLAQQETAETNRVNQAAQLGTAGYQQYAAAQGQAFTQGLQGRQQNLSEADAAERKRQFDTELSNRKAEFATQTGLSQAQLDEAIASRKAGNELQNKELQTKIDQFSAEMDQRQKEFGQTYSLEVQKVNQSNSQFGAELAQRKAEFTTSTGLSQQQLDEAVASRKAGNQLADRQLQAQVDQYATTLEQSQKEFEANLKVQLQQLSQSDRTVAMNELNAAYTRAATAGEATGTFVDPVTKIPYTTLEKIHQWSADFETNIGDYTEEELAGLSPEERAAVAAEGGGAAADNTWYGKKTPTITTQTLGLPGNWFMQQGFYNGQTGTVDRKKAADWLINVAYTQSGGKVVLSQQEADKLIDNGSASVTYTS